MMLYFFIKDVAFCHLTQSYTLGYIAIHEHSLKCAAA
jgi:hypothetical protein